MTKLFQVLCLLLSVALGTALGLVPVNTAQAAGPQVIEGAVVVLRLPEAWQGSSDEDDPARYYSWDYYNSSGGYRLPAQGRAMYLAGFGSGNATAAISGDGGCAIKAADGAVWCYGRNNLAGDGTRRDRPLPIRIEGLFAEQIEYVSYPYWSWGSDSWELDIDNNSQSLSSQARLRAVCVLTTNAEVKCWGRNQSRAMMSPETFLTTGGEDLSGAGVVAQDGTIHVWGAVKEDGANEIELQAVGVLPASYTRIMETNSQQYFNGYQYLRLFEWTDGNISWPPLLSTNEYLYRPSLLVASSTGIGISFAPRFSSLDATWPELPRGWGFNGNPTDSEPVYGAGTEVTIVSSTLGAPVADSENDCVRVESELLCIDFSTGDWTDGPSGRGDSGTNTSLLDSGLYFSYQQDSQGRTFDYAPLYEIPEGSGDIVEGGAFACAIDHDERVKCAPVMTYSTPDPVESPWEYSADAFVRHDTNLDGLLSLGTEMPIACGVGFQCDFSAESLSLDGDYLTAVGTLTRTARSAVTVSGVVEFEDGTDVNGGEISWASSDGLLRGSTTISSSGAFTLPARTGDGKVTFDLRYHNLVGCPSYADDYGESTIVSGLFTNPACVTHVSTATLPVSLTASVSGSQIVLPVVQGEPREIQLRFGDGTTPMAGVALSGAGPEQCSITTIDGLGGLYGCVRFAVSPTEWWSDQRPKVVTGADGNATIWMPTDADIELTASLTETDGISWSEVLDSFYDDGPNPDPYLFPGLIVAATPEPMSIRRGQLATIDSAVLVDGIDPAYGLSAALVPVDDATSTCTNVDELSDTSDEVGEVTFTACPSGTGEWRIVSTDGSFFPSAPFEITVTSPPMVSAIRLSGAALDPGTSFDPSQFEYEGYFTGTTARFSVTKESFAQRARVVAQACRRPTSGVRTCTVTVSLSGVTDVYTFTFRRAP
jgi:hypothetical protein